MQPRDSYDHAGKSRCRRSALGRRVAAALSIVGLLSTGLAACGSSSTPSGSKSTGSALTKVTIAYAAPVADQMLPVFAKAAGLFKANGIDADVKYLSAAVAIPALVSGQVQFVVGGAPLPEATAVNGTPLEYVGVWENAIDGQIVAAKAVPAARDMNGTPIAISSTGALSDFLVKLTDQRYGINMHEIPLGSFPNEITAFEKGSVDAFSGANPWQLPSIQKLLPGAHVVEDFRGMKGYPGTGVFVDAQHLNTSAEQTTVVKVLRALYQELSYYRTHPAQSISLIARTTGEDDATAKAAYDTTKAAFLGTLVPQLSYERNVLKALVPSEPSAKGFDASKLLNATYAKQAQS